MSGRIRRIQIRNYKSIGQAVVDLESFTALVGPNGAGKSNFLDALAFIQECLSQSIELAFKNRGGVDAVRRRPGEEPAQLGFRLDVDLPANLRAHYAFELELVSGERFRIRRELCQIDQPGGEPCAFEVADGLFEREIQGIRPKLSPDRLALFAASAIEEFRPIYDFLTSIRVYSIVPARLRELSDKSADAVLKADGSNAAAILARLGRFEYERLCELLDKIVPGVRPSAADTELLTFRQDVGRKSTWSFDALNMSDGTLRALALLLAVYQSQRPGVLAIEEPEATIHPGAAELLLQVLLDASRKGQVLISTHSPDILDFKELQDRQIRVVSWQDGETVIGPVSRAGREAIRERLFTPGELLRADELQPDLEAAQGAAGQLQLFGSTPLRLRTETR